MKKRRLRLLWYYSLPIRWKISISFFLATAVLLAAVVVIVYQVSSTLLVRKATTDTQNNIRLISAGLDRTLDEVIHRANTAITNRTVQTTLARGGGGSELSGYSDRISMTGALNSVVGSGVLIESFFVFDLEGRVFDSGQMQALSPGNISAYADILDMRNLPRHRWEDTHKSNYLIKNERRNIITYAKCFYNALTGDILGIMQTNVNERVLAGLYMDVSLGDTGRIFFLNRDGIVMSGRDAETLYVDMSGEPFFPMLSGNEGGLTFAKDAQEFLLVYHLYERLDWMIVGLVPAREITKENATLIQQVLLVLLGGFLLLSVIVLLISQSITKPIRSLSRAITDASDGDLDAQAEVFFHDEIGALAEGFNQMVHNTSLLMENLVREQKKKRQYELSLLQSQINPHFLYNTLENICGLAELKRNEDIILLAGELAAFFRGVLSGGSMIISIEEELEITRKYLNIVRHSRKDLTYELRVDEDILPYATIKLLMQPLVENAVKHGLPYQKGPWHITVAGHAEGETILLTVADNGIGIPPEKLGDIFESTSDCYQAKAFGLKATNERIKMYFGAECGLRLDSVYGNGVTVTAILPKIWYSPAEFDSIT